jgi:hypothetical protein
MLMLFRCRISLNLTLFITKSMFWCYIFLMLHKTLLYVYYTPLMTISSCKSILINCECMFWWFFFLQWAIWLAYHQKHYEIPPYPPKKIYIVVLHNQIKSYKCICFIFTFFYITM